MFEVSKFHRQIQNVVCQRLPYKTQLIESLSIKAKFNVPIIANQMQTMVRLNHHDYDND